MDLGWFQTISTGVIHSYVLVEQPIVGAFISSVPYVVAIMELDDCKQEDGTVTRVAGVLTDDHSKASKRLELLRLGSRQVIESTLSFACC